LIENFDERFAAAVQAFWTGRTEAQERQRLRGRSDAGSRGAVTAGGHIGVLEELIESVLVGCGIPAEAIFRHVRLELPGYYRSEKRWDLLVIANNRLHIAIEFKSQVGPSFGNNFNNRTEEAIGNAVDLLRALEEGTLGETVMPPFFGYMFLLEDCQEVHATICLEEPHFTVDEVFVAQPPRTQRKLNRELRSGVGYAKRYEILLQRLLREKKYDSACLTLTTRDVPTSISFPNQNLSAHQFVSRLEGFAIGAVKAGL
jgi:hypothetical protein